MLESNEHDINLNIHYSAPDWVWDKLEEVYCSMEYWSGYEQVPVWRGENIELFASVEPSGIQIFGKMPNEIWNRWFDELKMKLSQALGYEIGEPEDGYKFKYWNQEGDQVVEMKNSECRIIKIGRDALYELIYEYFIANHEELMKYIGNMET